MEGMDVGGVEVEKELNGYEGYVWGVMWEDMSAQNELS